MCVLRESLVIIKKTKKLLNKYMNMQSLPEVPTDNILSVLAWIIGTLLTFITLILIYLRYQNKIIIAQKDATIKEQKTTIADRDKRLFEEHAYSRTQDNANIKMITDTGFILNTTVDSLSKNSDKLDVVKSIMDINHERLKSIHGAVNKN